MGIEYAQYLLEIGLAETDDVLHNTLGGTLGVMTRTIPDILIHEVSSKTETDK